MSLARGQAAVAKCFWNLDLSSSPPCTESKRVSRSKFNGKCGSKRAMRGKIDLIKIPFEISCSLSSSTAERFSFRKFYKKTEDEEGDEWERLGSSENYGDWWGFYLAGAASASCISSFFLSFMNNSGSIPSRQPTVMPKTRPCERNEINDAWARRFLQKVLTMFEARLADFISSCTGVRSGALTPMTSTRRSTYTADPMPRTSEIVLPRAAAAIVDMVIIMPKLCSM